MEKKKIKTMSPNDTACKHQYIAGYSFRLPDPFFWNVPCDLCGQRIRLTLPWRMLYALVDVVCLIAAQFIGYSVHVKLFGETFFVSFIIFTTLFFVFHNLNRITLKHAKWIDVNQK
jgi:hypothetical protein